MKNSMLFMVSLCAAASAGAQSSVTLFGTVDINYQLARQGGVSVTRMVGSGANSYSALGFRGTEDLGGGLAAGFWIEGALNADNGSGAFGTSANNQVVAPGSANDGLVFNRRSTVSLWSQQWGELRLGRDVTPTYWNLTLFDPFGTTGSGAASNISLSGLTPVSRVQTAIRASNAIMYLTPGCTAAYGGPFGCTGFYGELMHARGENPSGTPNSQDGNYSGLRAGYAAGPFNISFATGTTRLQVGDVTARNVGASWLSGPVVVMAQYFSDKSDGATVPSLGRGWLIGARGTWGASSVPISYSTVRSDAPGTPTASKLAVGYVYSLSKRTAIYTTFSTVHNKNGAAAGGGGVPSAVNATWTGLDIGLRHHF
ncbi:MAG: porin [Ramlibacter sp.]|nr:porin [Ramlibacter sp.]